MTDRIQSSRAVRRAIILAAGRGSRLVMGEEIPKPLKPVAGVPLLVRILRTLQGEGITQAVVVVGYRGEQLKRALLAEPSLALELNFVENPGWDRGANGMSLLCAREWLDEDCILSMADHLYAPEIVRRLQEAELSGGCALAVDRDIPGCFDIDDATKVKLDGNRITGIAKELEVYDAIDTGVFRVNALLGDALQVVYDTRGDASLSDGVRALSATGRFVVVDAGDARWIDVDTPEAHARAEAMIRVWGDALGDDPPAITTIDPEAIEQFAPTWVRAARPYDEEHLLLAAERGAAERGVARLMANESPYAPSARVVEAIVAAATRANEYPVVTRPLKEKLAARDGVDPDGVVIGGGATELVDIAIRTFVAPGEEVLISVPTFSMYEARARVVGGVPVLVPLHDGGLDVPAILRAVTERTKLVFLCTPNNPTGHVLEDAAVRRVLRLGMPTVIDEAYVDLAGSRSHARAIAEFPNAIVLRTFSKAYGLAGMRLGWALTHPAVARLLSRAKLPWAVNAVSLAAAEAVLDDEQEHAARVAALRAGRAWLERELAAIPGIEVVRGEANFVLCDARASGVTSDALVELMLEGGVMIRSLVAHHMDRRYVRVSVGTEEQNVACVEAMRAAIGRRSARLRTADAE
ncbi:MAG: histidinol-phosphate transaminase [Deltaproteobacteria bacterium]|nr:histidinol-phosphate transaminase [Deltaproteobacteria bacterium]